MYALTTAPLWLAALLIVGVMTTAGMIGPIIARRLFPIDRLGLNNEVAGFKFATVGVIYAVILGFAVIVVWEKFQSAENAVAEEAGAVAAMYRLADGLGAETAATLRDRVTAYAKAVIHDDWPAMAKGSESPAVTLALTEIYGAALSHDPATNRGAIALAEILHQLDTVTGTRRDRLALATGIVPDVIWLVLLFGAAVTIVFTFFFGSRNLWAQAMMAGLLSFLISLGLLAIVSIDRPFSGSTTVQPEALELVLRDFAGG